MRKRILTIASVIVFTFAVAAVSDFSSVRNRCDINRDGIINIQDLVLVSNHFGKTSDYPVVHIHEVGDRVRGIAVRINDNPTNSYIDLFDTDPLAWSDEFRFYVPASTWDVEDLPELLYETYIDVRIIGLRSDGSYDATVIGYTADNGE